MFDVVPISDRAYTITLLEIENGGQHMQLPIRKLKSMD